MTKMYLIVNNSLNMNKGKIASQVGHAVSMIVRRLEKSPTTDYKNWLNDGEAKIVLKADSTILQSLRKYKNTVSVIDAGLTQIEEGSLTVVGFYPCKDCDVPDVIKTLKLV